MGGNEAPAERLADAGGVDLSGLEELNGLAMRSGPWIHQTLYVCAKLGLADRLASGPLPSAELAALVDADPLALQRFCRAMCALDLLCESSPGEFELTPMGHGLRKDAPMGVREFVILNGEECFRAWADVMHSVRTGKSAFEHVHGKSFFDYLAGNKDSSENFNAIFAEGLIPRVIADADFSSDQVIVDIGGGMGALITSILQANPQARGILQDLPAGVANAREYAAEHDITDRLEIVAKSFFESIPPGGDTYILCRVLHDWTDADALRVLQGLHRVMPDHARLLVVDQVIASSGPAVRTGRLSDVLMLVVNGGQERTAEEFRELLGQAGFEVPNVTMPGSGDNRPRAEVMIQARKKV